jgi:hypothetical protein
MSRGLIHREKNGKENLTANQMPKSVSAAFDFSKAKLPGKAKVREIMKQSAERMESYVQSVERMHRITERDLHTLLD